MEKRHVDIISENIQKFPLLTVAVGEDWILREAKKQNPASLLYFLAASPHSFSINLTQSLENNLRITDYDSLEAEHKSSIQKELRSTGMSGITGIMTELDLLAFFKKNGVDYVYQPDIHNEKGKRADFAIKLNKETILVEVFSLSKADKDNKFEQPVKLLQNQLKKINLPYHVSLGIKEVPEDKIKEIKSHVYKAMKDGQEGEIENPFPFLTKIRLKKYPDFKNVVVGTHWTFSGDQTDRLRRILRREAEQLHKDYKNLLIVNLSDFSDDTEFYNSLAGDEHFVFYIPKDRNAKLPKPHLRREKKDRFLQPDINTRVNCVIGYKHYFNGWKGCVLHPNPNKPFDEIEKRKLQELLS